MAGIMKPTSTELSIALDTIRAEIAYSKDRNISERQKNQDNPLHTKLPYLTWQGLQGCVLELEHRVRACLIEESLGGAGAIVPSCQLAGQPAGQLAGQLRLRANTGI
jgi:hypothetical protein